MNKETDNRYEMMSNSLLRQNNSTSLYRESQQFSANQSPRVIAAISFPPKK